MAENPLAQFGKSLIDPALGKLKDAGTSVLKQQIKAEIARRAEAAKPKVTNLDVDAAGKPIYQPPVKEAEISMPPEVPEKPVEWMRGVEDIKPAGIEAELKTPEADWIKSVEEFVSTTKKKEPKVFQTKNDDLIWNFMSTDKFKPQATTFAKPDLMFSKPPEVIDNVSLNHALDIDASVNEYRKQAIQQYEALPHEEKVNLLDKYLEDKAKDQRRYEFMKSVDQGFTDSLKAVYGDEELKKMEQTGALKGILEKGIGGFFSGASIGITDQLLNYVNDYDERGGYEPDILYEENRNLAVTGEIFGIVNQFAGGLTPYSAISGQVARALESVGGRFGTYMATHPTVTAYAFRNLGEEGVEFGVRKATGQQYTMSDFILGMSIGAGFESLARLPKSAKVIKDFQGRQKEVMKKVESSVKLAEIEKGAQLTNKELEDAVMRVKINDEFDVADLYRETRLAYLKEKGTRPGIDTPAPLRTDIKVDAPTVKIAEPHTRKDIEGISGKPITNVEGAKTYLSVDRDAGYVVKDDVATIYAKTPEAKVVATVDAVEGGAKTIEVPATDVKIYEPIGFSKTETKLDNILMKLDTAKYEQFKTDNPNLSTKQFADMEGFAPKKMATTKAPEGAELKAVKAPKPEGFKVTKLTPRESRAKVLKTIKAQQGRVAEVKQTIVGYAKAELPLKERGKLLATVKNAKTWQDLDEARAMIMKLGEESEVRSTKVKIEKELKQTKVKKKAGVPSGKYDADTQAKLEKIKKMVKVDKQVAERNIWEKLKKYDNEAVPSDVLAEIEILKMAGIGEMNSKELANVLEQIKSLKETGKLKAQIKALNKELELANVKDDIVEVLTGGKPLVEGRGIDVKDIDKSLFGTLRKIDNWQHGWSTFLDKLSKFDTASGVFKSKLSKFGEIVYDARRAQDAGMESSTALVQTKFLDIFGTKGLRKIAKKQTKVESLGKFKFADGKTEEIRLSQNQAGKHWQLMEDPTLKDTYDKMGWTPEIKKAVTDFMTPETKAWADWQLNEFYPEYYKGVNKVFRDMYGVDLPFNKKYTPIVRDVDGMIAGDALLIQQAKEYTSITTGSLKNRVDSAIPLKAVDMDQILMKHITEMEHFKAFGETISTLRKVFGDSEVRTAIKQYHGKDSMNIIDNMINDIAADGVQKSKIIRSLDKMRGNFTKAVIGLNPSVFVKQLTSLPAMAGDIPLKDFMKGLADLGIDTGAKLDILRESPVYRARYSMGFERDLKQAMASNEFGMLTGKDRWSNKAMFPTKWGDKVPILAGGWSVYKYNYDKLIKEMPEFKAKDIALKEFEMSFKRTQQSANVEDLAGIQRLGSFGKLFTMFQTSPNQYYRMASGALRNLRYGRGSKAENIKKLLISWVVLPSLFQLTADGFNVREKSLKRAVLLGPMNGILAVGGLFEAITRMFVDEKRFGDETVPGPLASIDDLLGAVTGMVDMTKDYADPAEAVTYEDVGEVLDDLMGQASKFVGVPYKPAKTVATGIKEVATGETKDLRRLIYTPYALREEEEKKKTKVTGGPSYSKSRSGSGGALNYSKKR